MTHLYRMLSIPDTTMPEGARILSYTEWGKENNPNVLFCVHGLSRNARDFDYVAQSLSDEYRVICIDIAGRGQSQWLADKKCYSYETYVADCVYLLKTLGIKRVDWLGTSMGGLIGMFVAMHMPQLIHRLILNDIGPHISGGSLRRIIKYVQNTRKYATHEDISAMLRLKLSTFGIASEEHWNHMIEHSVMQTKDGRYMFNYDPAIVKSPLPGQAIPDVELFDVWQEVSHQTLVIRGEKSDVLTPMTAEAMRSSGPEPELVVLPNIGHAPALMDHAQVELIRGWLKTGQVPQ